MLTNDIKKGARLVLKSGWMGTMMDNKKGNIRLVDVEGTCREIGSVYAWDIHCVIEPESGKTIFVELTDKQIMQRDVNKSLFGNRY